MTLIGHTIMAEIVDTTTNATTVWTPWFPRRGDGVTSTWEVIALSSPNKGKLTVKLYEKNSEDTGDGSENTTTSGTTSTESTGVLSFRNTACKELVRYRITLSEATTAPTNATLFAHFRVLSPSWESSGYQGV